MSSTTRSTRSTRSTGFPSAAVDLAEGVSASTAQALRAAMERLLAGRPQRSDGRLIKDNLYREAGVSRATMNRAHAVLAEWETRTAATGSRTPAEARRDDQITKLTRALTDKARDCTRLQQQLDAAATVIAALHHDNTALREQLEQRHGTVITLDRALARTPPQ